MEFKFGIKGNKISYGNDTLTEYDRYIILSL